MMYKPVTWSQLRGKTFRTITGASFTVTNVTRKSVIIRPEHGRRDYDLSISDELERGLNALLAGDFFPSPTELLRIGVRHERNSYVWGVLKIVWQDTLAKPSPTVRAQDFAGNWEITELSDMDSDYLKEGDEGAYITIRKPTHESLNGSYRFGFSGGDMNGTVRKFGGESVFIFGFDGADEMDPVTGGGWARLNAHDELEGEFVGQYGPFKAARKSNSHSYKRKA